MTPTIRSIVLLTGCYLASACSEPQPAPSAQKPAVSQPVVTAPKQDTLKAELEALTSLSPARPGSLADGQQHDNKPSVMPAVEIEAHADEPGGALSPGELTDYDRPLDPRTVKIDRFVLAHKVEGREPVDEGDVFSADTKEIFAFVQLANDKDAPYAFTVHWEPVDGPASPYGVKLTVPTASRWRTWSWTRIQREPGKYKAVLRTVDGEDIATKEFTIEASPTLEDLK
jgi:hypothetical protein